MHFAVESAKLNLKTGRYDSLKHKIGNRESAEFQHKILEDYAKNNNAIPLYAFYNHLDSDDAELTKKWNCHLIFERSKLGCTVTPLRNVKKAISTNGWRNFDKIHAFPETVPLRCLAACSNISCEKRSFGVKATVYKNPWGWISEMGHLKSFKQMPIQYYDHELGYYPKRILLIQTSESGVNKCTSAHALTN